MSNIITKTFDTLNDKTRGMFAYLEVRKYLAVAGAVALLAEMQDASAAKVSFRSGAWHESQYTTQKLDKLAENITDTADTGAAMFFNLITILGFVLVALGLYQLYKASKDEREKPMSAVIGIVIGGMMSAAGLIAYAIRNSMFENMEGTSSGG